jgi:MYXO-CTERM domain-containing protein
MQYKIHTLRVPATILVALLTCVNVSRADPNALPPGGFISPLNLSPGPSAGATLVDSETVTWGPSLSFSGTLTSSVWQNDANNPLGGLTFTYQLSLSGASTNGVGELALSHFALSTIDLTAEGPVIGVVPNAAGRSAAAIDNGDDVNLFFFSEMTPGSIMDTIVIDTSATEFQNGLASVIDHSAVPNIATLSPLVPEPSSFAFCLGGLGILALWRRRRKN